ncbi:MAG TPA: cation transporter, partial [Candidatus Binataceae bacterium]|nr:cation transporter [Candidatus Binataceae bacterium]
PERTSRALSATNVICLIAVEDDRTIRSNLPEVGSCYVHNLGDTLLSLAPVAAGVLVLITGRSFFDPMVALLIAGFIPKTTIGSIAGSHPELMWPENVVCGHDEPAQATRAEMA